MHGIIGAAESGDLRSAPGKVQALLALPWRIRFFGTLVVLPTLVIAGYYYLIASDQYESSAAFVVRRAPSF